MYVVTVAFEIEPGQMQAFLPLMNENARTSKDVEPDCLQFDVCVDDAGGFLYEVYRHREGFDAHLNSYHFRTFDAAVARMVTGKQVRVFERVTR